MTIVAVTRTAQTQNSSLIEDIFDQTNKVIGEPDATQRKGIFFAGPRQFVFQRWGFDDAEMMHIYEMSGNVTSMFPFTTMSYKRVQPGAARIPQTTFHSIVEKAGHEAVAKAKKNLEEINSSLKEETKIPFPLTPAVVPIKKPNPSYFAREEIY